MIPILFEHNRDKVIGRFDKETETITLLPEVRIPCNFVFEMGGTVEESFEENGITYIKKFRLLERSTVFILDKEE